jgi:hypothetical protein
MYIPYIYRYIYFINVNSAKQVANRAKRAAAHRGTSIRATARGGGRRARANQHLSQGGGATRGGGTDTQGQGK